MSGQWNDPSPPGTNDDARKLRSMFPEEVWLMVLESLNPPDLESFNNASPFFRRLLYPKRTTFLFASVWKVLGVQYEYDADPVYCDLELKRGDLNLARLKERQPYFSVILKLRLVCREWCLALDKFYEDLYSYDTRHSVHKARVESGLDSGDEVRIKREYHGFYSGHWRYSEFTWADEVRDFMEHFMATHDTQNNPFPFRKVIIRPGELLLDDYIEYCSRVIQLLTKYGHHIWFCEIHIIKAVHSRLEVLIKIREMLTLMPNLKVLRLNDSSFHNSDCKMTNRVEEKMKEALVAHPLSRFESLRMLTFYSTDKILMEHILETNDHVVKVEFKCGLENLNFAKVPLPNLTQLAICLETTEDFEQLEKCGPLWKLEMLHLAVSDAIADNISHSRIFKCLEQWRNSLSDVVVNLPRAKRKEDKAELVRNFEMRLDLPSVQRLRLLMHNIRSLDFILPMRNALELLEYSRNWRPMDWKTIPKELLDGMKTKEVIQFHAVENDDMYKSNIWSLFPKLGRIHVGDGDDITLFNNGPAYIRRKMKTLGDQ